MINKLKREYDKKRFEFYKGVILDAAETSESRRLLGMKEVDKVMFCDVLSEFCGKNNIKQFYDEFVGDVKNFWKNEKVYHAISCSKKLMPLLYKVSLATNKWSYAAHHVEDLREMSLLKRVIDLLDENSKAVFVDFPEFNALLEKLPFTKNEKVDLMLQIIRLNDERFKSGAAVVPYNLKAVKDNVRNIMIKPIVLELVNYDMLDRVDELDLPFEKTIKKYLNKVHEEYPLDTIVVENACSEIVSLLDKGNILDDGVKEELVANFEYLYCPYVYGTLAVRENRIIKQQMREAEIERRKEEHAQQQQPVEEKKPFTKKERNALLRGIKEIYNFETGECVRILSMDEIIEIVSKLIILNADDYTIDTFIRSAEKNLRTNPIMAYSELLDKMRSTITSESVTIYIDMVALLIDDVYKNANDEEKCISLMNEIDEYIRIINNAIGWNYSYEREKAKKLLGRTN